MLNARAAGLLERPGRRVGHTRAHGSLTLRSFIPAVTQQRLIRQRVLFLLNSVRQLFVDKGSRTFFSDVLLLISDVLLLRQAFWGEKRQHLREKRQHLRAFVKVRKSESLIFGESKR